MGDVVTFRDRRTLHGPENATGKYVLDVRGEPRQEPDVIRWAEWYERAENRIVGTAQLPNGVRVSTIFLGLDYRRPGMKEPVLWETMIFGGRHDRLSFRYTSGAHAARAHAALILVLQKEGATEIEVRSLVEAARGAK